MEWKNSGPDPFYGLDSADSVQKGERTTYGTDRDVLLFGKLIQGREQRINRVMSKTDLYQQIPLRESSISVILFYRDSM